MIRVLVHVVCQAGLNTGWTDDGGSDILKKRLANGWPVFVDVVVPKHFLYGDVCANMFLVTFFFFHGEDAQHLSRGLDAL